MRVALKALGANGQGATLEECVAKLRAASVLILEHRWEECLGALPPEAEHGLIVVE